MGDVGTWMIDCAYAQVGKRLGLPTHAYLGMSDAKILDAQCGMESAGGTFLAALALFLLTGDKAGEKVAERSTSRLLPGVLPACGSEGAPVCARQSASCCTTKPSSP